MSDSLWTVVELAAYLGYKPKTVSNMLSGEPHKLPPRVAALSSPRWEPATVRAWAAEQSQPLRRGGGRPRARV